MSVHDNHSKFFGVGDSRVDHVAIEVARGMMIAATTLFVKLGYHEAESRRVSGDWGSARFMVKSGSIPIQLTESSGEMNIVTGENHVAIAVDEPELVAEGVQYWLHLASQRSEIEEVSGGKFFLTVPSILTQSLEFVPND